VELIYNVKLYENSIFSEEPINLDEELNTKLRIIFFLLEKVKFQME